MSARNAETKKEIRERALLARRAVTPDELDALSARVGINLVGQPEFKRARCVASYVGMKGEVQTAAILEGAIASRKRVIVPKTDVRSGLLLFYEIRGLESLGPGTFGVLEPLAGDAPQVPLAASDVVLVPLLAWDARGFRVGYGKGYFDRALADRGRSVAIGLALEAQKVDRVPETSHDVRLDMVLTERRVLRFGAKSEEGVGGGDGTE
jgi:5-formyltetrahydrofolate cyclo-ligase